MLNVTESKWKDRPLAERVAELFSRSFQPSPQLLEEFGFPAVYQRRERAKRKSIPRTTQIAVFKRDCFIDRYTGEKLIFPGALLLLGEIFPDAFPTPKGSDGWRVGQCHPVYWSLWPTVDHILPVAIGGSDAIDNLVTTCQIVNSAKGPWTGEEAPEKVRFKLLPLEDAMQTFWHGAYEWFLARMRSSPELRGRNRVIDGWYKDAERVERQEALARGLAPYDPMAKPRWDPNDFEDNHVGRVREAPLKERLESLAERGLNPSEVSDDIRERYIEFLKRRARVDRT